MPEQHPAPSEPGAVKKLRVAICQALLPRYREPVFNLLGGQPGIELTIFADGDHGCGGTDPELRTFRLEPAPVLHMRFAGQEFRFQPAQLRVADPNRFDLVILPWDTRFLSLPPAILLARLRGLPTALWGHGFSRRAGGSLRDRMRNVIGQRADAVLLYTSSVARRLVDQEGFPPGRVFVAQNALDQKPIRDAHAQWTAQPTELQALAHQHGIDPARTVIFVSRLVAENHIELLLRAMAIVCSREPRAKLVIIGDGPERATLETMVSSLSLAGHVIFTGTLYEEWRIAPWMLNAAVMCYPLNIGLSLLHAFGYGLPVITGDDLQSHGPEIEALAPGINGLLSRHKDVDHMAEQCLNILTDAELRRKLSQGALQTVSEQYTVEHMVQGFLDLLSIADGNRRVLRPVRFKP